MLSRIDEKAGKKMLMDAYLNNNNSDNNDNHNKTNESSPKHSKQNSNTATSSPLGTMNNKPNMGDVVESGIGTYDEIGDDSFNSVEKDAFSYFNDFEPELEMIHQQQQQQDKKNRKVDNQNLNLNSIINDLDDQINDLDESNNDLNKTEDQYCLTKRKSPVKNRNKKVNKSEDVEAICADLKTKTSKNYNNSNDKPMSLCKKILLSFLVLLSAFILFLCYFVYILFINPSCCDFKRNYLVFNVETY
jgi:hypothetical protein